MFIRLQKELDDLLKQGASDQCYHCGQRLTVPPVIDVYNHLYHADCAYQLAYSILYSVTGEPNIHTHPLQTPPVGDRPTLRQ